MAISTKIGNLKRKRILALSAGGARSGIQSVYFETEAGGWEVISQTFVPYPAKTQNQIDGALRGKYPKMRLSDLAVLDLRISRLFLDCAKTTLAQAPPRMVHAEFTVMNRLGLWLGGIEDVGKRVRRDLSLGDAQYLASSLNTPVLTDFVRHDIYGGGEGRLPVAQGFLKMARKADGVSVFVNIGLIARVVAVNPSSSSVIVDSDAGPGTCLINVASQDAGSRDGFDRDGSHAAAGTVSNDCLEILASSKLLASRPQRSLQAKELLPLLDMPCLKELEPADRVATLTALTARTIFEFLRREYRLDAAPESIWICGGGAHNLTLMEYLKMYGDPVPVESVEKLGVLPDSCIALALGLTTVARLEGQFRPPRGKDRSASGNFATLITP